MPKPIRAMLSVFVAVLAVLLWIFRESIHINVSPVLFFGLAAAMIASVWLFPEFKKQE